MSGNFLSRSRQEVSWVVGVNTCAVREYRFLWDSSYYPPLPVHLANGSRSGPEIIPWCDGLLSSAQENL